MGLHGTAKPLHPASELVDRVVSPRFSAIERRPSQVSWRNQASQMLSPRPSAPTRFMPSFQSPASIRGSPRGDTWAADLDTASMACSQSVPSRTLPPDSASVQAS
jgi:hypothetical protein